MSTKVSPRKKNTGAASSASVVIVNSRGRPAAKVPASVVAPAAFKIARILVPVDFSEPSRKALHYAVKFAEQFDATVSLVHVVEPVLYPPDLGYVPVAPEDLEEQRMKDLQAHLKSLADSAGATVKVEHQLRLGRSWKEIVDLATEAKADLIVVATHGYTGLKHALLGSVAEKVVRHAHCPVLVVRSDEHDFA